MHCKSEYTAPYKEVNLNAMNSIQKIFNVKTGYSDHRLGIEVSLAAVAQGQRLLKNI